MLSLKRNLACHECFNVKDGRWKNTFRLQWKKSCKINVKWPCDVKVPMQTRLVGMGKRSSELSRHFMYFCKWANNRFFNCSQYHRCRRSVTEPNNVLSKISMGGFYFLKIMWSIIDVAVLRPGTWTLKMGALHCIRKPLDTVHLVQYFNILHHFISLWVEKSNIIILY